MTEQERRAVVEQRRAYGLPLHRPPHFDFGDGWYLISAATYEHACHFQQPLELTALTRRLLTGLQNENIPVAGWVVMPNHYHVLVYAKSVPEVGRVVGPVHGRSARYANRRDGRPGRQVWYKYSDRKVRSERHYWTCLHYVIMNPVKHGFAPSYDLWPWSCLHELRAQLGDLWIEDLRRDYPLLAFGKDWDEYRS